MNLSSGFTLIEVLIVIALGIFLTGLTLPVGLRFYQSQVADETSLEVLAQLRGAASAARLGRGGQPMGLKFFPDRYVVFEGASYDARSASRDQTFVFPSGTAVASTTSEFVFAPVSGLPSSTGTLALTLYGATHTIAVNEAGVVSESN